MSNNNSLRVINRNIVYLCKIHGNQLRKGDNTYSGISETIQIVFNNFDCQDELRNTYYLRNDKGNILSKETTNKLVDRISMLSRDDSMVRLYIKLSRSFFVFLIKSTFLIKKEFLNT